MKALKGEEYILLLLKDDPFYRVRVRDSLHLNKKAHTSFRIGVVHVVSPGAEKNATLEVVVDYVRNALSGNKSGPATVASSRTFAADPRNCLISWPPMMLLTCML